MRKLIIKHFVLGTFITLFGKTFHTLRAARIIFPSFCLVGAVIAFDPLYPFLQWYDFVGLLWLLILVWIGFPFFKWSYFNLYKVSYEELVDDEQRYDWVRAYRSNGLSSIKYQAIHTDEDGRVFYVGVHELTIEELDNFRDYKIIMEKEHYDKKFSNLYNLSPLLIGIAIIVIKFYLYNY